MKLGQRDGVTLIELLIVMAVVMFVLTAASQFLSSMITQFKQQTKIAETNIESAVGLQILRRDILSAGFGLPTSMTITYQEAVDSNPATFNDATADLPRAVIGTNPSFAVNGSDYLVIKSLAVAEHRVAGKWHFLDYDGNKNTIIPADRGENLQDSDRVVVIRQSKTLGSVLVTAASGWYTTFGDAHDFRSTVRKKKNIIYGVDPDSDLRFPFNRADYYISSEPGLLPEKCAPGTGVLVKAVLRHSDRKLGAEMPLLDCVADMQVVFARDTDDVEGVDTKTDDTDGLSADDIGDQVGEVQVYILAHEGQKDPTYEYATNPLRVGPPGFGREFNFSGITDWEHYRWKVYVVSEKPALLMTKNRK